MLLLHPEADSNCMAVDSQSIDLAERVLALLGHLQRASSSRRFLCGGDCCTVFRFSLLSMFRHHFCVEAIAAKLINVSAPFIIGRYVEYRNKLNVKLILDLSAIFSLLPFLMGACKLLSIFILHFYYCANFF